MALAEPELAAPRAPANPSAALLLLPVWNNGYTSFRIEYSWWQSVELQLLWLAVRDEGDT